MRKALVALNLLVAAASAGLFAYTFFARDHLVALAEDYVVARTVRHATPAVERVEAALAAPQAWLAPAPVRDAVRAEIDAYRSDPDGYVRAAVAKGAEAEGAKHPFAEQVVRWKRDLRRYFGEALASLVRDLRIFAGTNAVAGLLAAVLAWRARGRWRWHVLGLSVLLLLSLALHGYLFIDGLTFFRIVAGVRAGWSYPALMALTFAYLYARFGRFVPLAPGEPNPASPQKPAGVG
jgi:hypothetical protein